MKKYQILEHKADLKIKAFGKTKKELFENALKGMFEGTKYIVTKREVKREISVSSFDLSALLVDFLNEALYFSEIEKEVYSEIEFEMFSDKEIKGILVGRKLERIAIQIKGVTHHDLDVLQREDGIWEAIILFDI